MNRTLLVSVITAAWALSLGCASRLPEPESPLGHPLTARSIPADLKYAVRRAESVGRALYLLDRVGAIASDELTRRVGDPARLALGGYLPIRLADEDGAAENRFAVLFFTNETLPRAQFEVQVAPGMEAKFIRLEPPRDLSAAVLTLVAARQAAIQAKPETHQPVSPIVLPGAAMDQPGVLVYLLAGTQKENLAVLGQHFRVVVSQKDVTVSSVTPLSKSAIEIPTIAPRGDRVSELFITDPVAEYPLETHVLASLQSGLPLVVSTRRGSWFIEDGKVAYWGQRRPQARRWSSSPARSPKQESRNDLHAQLGHGSNAPESD